MQAVCADFPQAYCWRINSFLFAARLRKSRYFNEGLLPKVVFFVRMIAAHVRVLMPGPPIFFAPTNLPLMGSRENRAVERVLHQRRRSRSD